MTICNKNWFIILSLIIFAPLGIYLMWKNTNWNRTIKIAISVICGILLVGSLFMNTEAKTEQVKPHKTEIMVEEKYSAVVSYEDYGKYGEPQKLTDDGLTKEYIACKLPKGKYKITNVSNYMEQVSIYQDGYSKNEDGHLEQNFNGERCPVLEPYESVIITINEDDYLQLLKDDVFKVEEI